MQNLDGEWEELWTTDTKSNANVSFELLRRNDKITMQTSPIHFVAATQNWIVKAVHYNVYFAHQSDTALIAVQVMILTTPLCQSIREIMSYN